ncbi:TPA: hypothetical protein ACH3X3_012909 [Trebouxia sp. C0006]
MKSKSHRPSSLKAGPEVVPPFNETWAAMESLVDRGLVRSIGVSNFSPEKIQTLLKTARIRPAVKQVEVHCHWRNDRTVDWCKKEGIHVTACAPLSSPQTMSLEHKDIPNLLTVTCVAVNPLPSSSPSLSPRDCSVSHLHCTGTFIGEKLGLVMEQQVSDLHPCSASAWKLHKCMMLDKLGIPIVEPSQYAWQNTSLPVSAASGVANDMQQCLSSPNITALLDMLLQP